MIESAEEFVRLRQSTDPEEYLRAAHDEVSMEVWLDVVEHYPEMRFWVAQNKKVPAEVLEILSRDSDFRVRCMVASKRKLPEHVQMVLAKDEQEAVRHQLVCNPKATLAVLEALASDPWDQVRAKASSRLAERSQGHGV